ncbi:MAG: methyltransferase domain-containing protein [Christensenella sp.]|uniref:class I SAM-dependent methyltransferase n=1 Tax=Christensenella sp. TaxID=1935934 RepID=UPI002B1F3733|nr:methyltransferase domain-containing protein [Christensenella sp.]MEA5001984.1 methyltransferase domain-containing protein [Christensenella sp.]
MGITKKVLENCKRPQGMMGRQTIKRMNKSHAELTEWGFSKIDIRDTDTVLDVGCGGGKALKLLSKRALHGKLYGIDYSETSVDCACKENKSDVQSGKMMIVHGSVSDMPFESDFFDVITSVESYYFWPDLSKDLKEVLRVLKPDGMLLIVAEMYDHAQQSEKDKQIVQMLGMHNNTPEEFRDMLRQAGYQNVQVEENNEHGWICVRGIK